MGFNIDYPQALLQPWKSLKQFTEELYSMLTEAPAGAPQAAKPVSPAASPLPPTSPQVSGPIAPIPAPPQRRPVPVPTLAAYQAQVASAAQVAPQVVMQSTTPPAVPSMFSPPPTVATASFETMMPSPHKIPDIATNSVTENSPAREEKKKLKGWPIPDYKPGKVTPPQKAPDPSSPASLYFGQVVSGGPGPGPYSVNLFCDGPTQPASADAAGDTNPVNVMIQTLASTETLPVNMWLFNIFQFQDSNGNNLYFAQPPVWMS